MIAARGDRGNLSDVICGKDWRGGRNLNVRPPSRPITPNMDTLIIGAGGHGKVVLDILRAAGLHKPVGFIDADPSLAGTSVGGVPVLGAANLLPKLRQQNRIRSAI